MEIWSGRRGKVQKYYEIKGKPQKFEKEWNKMMYTLSTFSAKENCNSPLKELMKFYINIVIKRSFSVLKPVRFSWVIVYIAQKARN